MTKENLKTYCENEFKWLNRGGSVEKAFDRAYGAMMFFCTFASSEDDKEIGKWWNDEMRVKFLKLQMEEK